MALMFPAAPQVAVSMRDLVAGGRLVQRDLATHEALGTFRATETFDRSAGTGGVGS
jgi:hypothetical protein